MSNAANMLLTRGAIPYTNDSNGNTLTGGGRTSIWDSQNRLAQCTFGAATSTFTYAADGIRHRTVTGANTTDYVLDGPMFVREKLNGAVSATYLVGPRGPEYRRDHATGTIRWYCYDGLGSVLGECDSSGNLTATRSYDVYGAVRTSAGTSTSKHKYVGSLGHPSEDESGLIYMRARYMDPMTGRFLNEDPAHEGPNWFTYCRNYPTGRIDPGGTESASASDILEVLDQFFKAIGIKGGVGPLPRALGKILAGLAVAAVGIELLSIAVSIGAFAIGALATEAILMLVSGMFLIAAIAAAYVFIAGAVLLAAATYSIMSAVVTELCNCDPPKLTE